MRCDCCNKNLNDFESTLKSVEGEWMNTCMKCIKGLGIKTVGRQDLDPLEAPPDEYEISDDWMDIGDLGKETAEPFDD